MNVLNGQTESSQVARNRRPRLFARLAAGVALVASMAMAANAQVVEYSVISGQPSDAGSTFEVGVVMTGNAVGPLDAYSLRINYDATEFDDVSVTTPDPGGFLFDALELGPEVLSGDDAHRIVAAAYSGDSGPNANNGHFATVTFTRSALASPTPTWSIEANPDSIPSAFITGADSTPIFATVTFVPSVDPDTAVIEYSVEGDASLPNNLINVVVNLTDNALDIGGYAFTFDYDPSELSLAGDAIVPAGSSIQSEELITTNVGPDSGRVNVAGLISLPENTDSTGGLFIIPFMTGAVPGPVDIYGIPNDLVLGDNPDVPDNLITFGADSEVIPHIFRRVAVVDPVLPTPINPTPSNGAVGLAQEVAASWSLDGDQYPGASFEVFLWESGDSKPVDPTFETTSMSVTFENLDPFTTYHWQVANVFGALSSESAVWEFTTSVDPDTAVVEYSVLGDATVADSEFIVLVDLSNNSQLVGAFNFSFTYDSTELTPGEAILDPDSGFQFEQLITTVVEPGRVNVIGATAEDTSTTDEGIMFAIPFTTGATPGPVDGGGIPESLVLDDNPDVVNPLLVLSNEIIDIPHIFIRGAAAIPVVLATPVNPFPANGATDVATTVNATWSLDGDPVLGSSFDVLLWAEGDSPTVVDTTTEMSSLFDGLDFLTTYNWQVVNRLGADSSPSNVWSFTTAPDPDVAIVDYYAIGDASAADTEFVLIAEITNNMLPVGAISFSITYDENELIPGEAANFDGSEIQFDQLVTTVVEPGRVNISAAVANEEDTAAEAILFQIPFTTTATPGPVDGFFLPVSLELGDNPLTPNAIVALADEEVVIPNIYRRVEGIVVEMPGAPISPTPANGAENVFVETILGWEPGPGGDVDTYSVFLWETGSPEPGLPTAVVATNSFDPGGLATSTDYSWRVVANNALGSASSATWTFSTAFNDPTAIIAYTVLGNAGDSGSTITLLANLENNVHDIGAFSFAVNFDPNELIPLGNARPVPGSNFEEYDQLITNDPDTGIRVVNGLIISEELTAATGGLFELDFVTSGNLTLDMFGIPVNLVMSDPPLSSDNLLTFEGDNSLAYVFERRATAPAEILVAPTEIAASTLVGSSPDDDSFVLTNIGMGANLNYTITSDQPWVSVAAEDATGTLAAGQNTDVTVVYDADALTPGVYEATITVSDLAAINNPQTVHVTLTVIGAAIIAVDPLLVERTVAFGENAAPEVITVTNTGFADLNFSVEILDGGDSWLSVAPDAGTLAMSESTTFTLTFDVAEVPGGDYTARVRVTDPAAVNDPVDVTVNLTVEDERALIAVNPESIEVTTDFMVNAEPTTFTLTNAGGQPLVFEITTDVPSWLAVDPTTGTLAASASTDIDVMFDVVGVEPGVYTGEIIITDDDAQNSPVTIPVTLTINETRAIIALDPEEINVVALLGTDADPESFSITNDGFSDLVFDVSVSETWLDAAPTTGTVAVGGTSFVDLNFSTAALDVGEYTATVTVSDPDAVNSPQSVTVNLSVLGPEPIIAFNPDAIEVETDLNVNPADMTFLIANEGLQAGSVMNYELTTDAGWISVNPTTGTLVADGVSSDSITLSFDIIGVEPGEYTANVIATSDEAQNSPAMLPVTITINETRAIIALDPDEINLQITEGTDAEPTTFTITNVGPGVLHYSVTLEGDDPETWIAVSATTGTLTQGMSDEIDLTFSTAGVPAGSYSATIVVSDPDAANSPQSIAINLEVLEAPVAILALSRGTLDVDIAEGTNAGDVPFDVENLGEASLDYSIALSFDGDVEDWFSVDPVSGTVAGESEETVIISFQTDGLEPGTYNGTITVTAPGAENSPQVLFVSATVINTAIVFNFEDDTNGWIFEFDSFFFTESEGSRNEDRESLEIATFDNTNTHSYWRTDPDNPIQIATPGTVVTAKRSKNVIAGKLGDDSLFRAMWTAYADTPATGTPEVRFRVSSDDFAISHLLVAVSTGNFDTVPTADGREYTQYFSQPGHIDRFSLFFDIANFSPEFAVAEATLGIDRVSIESLGTQDLGEGTEIANFNFLEDAQGFTFRTVEGSLPNLPEIAPAIGLDPSGPEGLGLGIAGAEEEGQPNEEHPEVIYGWWGLESDVEIPVGSLVKLAFTVRSDIPVGQETELSTFRLRLNASRLGLASLLVTHPARGANVPSFNPDTGEYNEVTYNMWFEAPQELEGQTFILSFDFLSTPGFTETVDPFWGIGLTDLVITVFDAVENGG